MYSSVSAATIDAFPPRRVSSSTVDQATLTATNGASAASGCSQIVKHEQPTPVARTRTTSVSSAERIQSTRLNSHHTTQTPMNTADNAILSVTITGNIAAKFTINVGSNHVCSTLKSTCLDQRSATAAGGNSPGIRPSWTISSKRFVRPISHSPCSIHGPSSLTSVRTAPRSTISTALRINVHHATTSSSISAACSDMLRVGRAISGPERLPEI